MQEKLRQQAFEAIRALDTEVQSRPSKLLEESKEIRPYVINLIEYTYCSQNA